MSTLKVNNLQVGQDGTAANNYTLYQPASPDGTVRLGYGVPGSVTDILTLKNSKLGIGTDNPGAKLHTYGGDVIMENVGGIRFKLRRDDTSTAGERNLGSIEFQGNDSSGTYETGAEIRARSDFGHSDGDKPTRLEFLTTPDNSATPVERLRITSAGLVGINTDNPQKTLHVNSSVDNSFGIVRISGKNRGGQLEFCTDATKTAGIYSPTSSNELVFFTSSSETERLRIASDGLVSIPVAGSLQVGGASSGETDTKIYVANTGGNAYIQLKGADSTGTVGLKFGRNSVANRVGIDWSAATDKLTVRTGGTNPRITVTSGGNVGVGTDTPAEKLEVYGNGRFKAADGSHGIELYPDVGGLGYQRIISYNRTSSAYENFSIGANDFIVTSGDTSESLRITSGGRVLVGHHNEVAGAYDNTAQTKQLQIINGNNDGNQGLGIYSFSSAGWAPRIELATSRSTSFGGHTVVTNGQSCGLMVFNGSDGTNFSTAAMIGSSVDGTPADNAIPGSLSFYTSPGSGLNERLRITSDGHKFTNEGSIFHGSNDITDFTGASRNSYNNVSIRAGYSGGDAIPTNRTSAIKIYPVGTRNATAGTLTGGIAWQHLDPNNGSWSTAYGEGAQIWMGAAIHDVPGQERDRFNLWMNSSTTGNSNPNNLAIEVYPNGVVRHPKVPAFYAYRNNDSGQKSAGDQVYNATRLNNGSHYDTSNGRFTAPIDGIYLFSASIQLYGGPSTGHAMSFRINGTDFHGSYNSSNPVYDEKGGTHSMLYFTAVIGMVQNDYVTVYTSQTVRGMQSYFTGHLVG